MQIFLLSFNINIKVDIKKIIANMHWKNKWNGQDKWYSEEKRYSIKGSTVVCNTKIEGMYR